MHVSDCGSAHCSGCVVNGISANTAIIMYLGLLTFLDAYCTFSAEDICCYTFVMFCLCFLATVAIWGSYSHYSLSLFIVVNKPVLLMLCCW